jgi:hypothetical protein
MTFKSTSKDNPSLGLDEEFFHIVELTMKSSKLHVEWLLGSCITF